MTRLGVGSRNRVPVDGDTDLESIVEGGRIGRWITMKTLAIKCQLKLHRECPQNATVKVHLFLVLDKNPTVTFASSPGVNDILFDLSDKKYAKFNGMAKVDNKQKMMFTLPKSESVQQRFRVLQKRTVYLSRGASAALPIDTNALPPYQRCTPPGPPSIGTGTLTTSDWSATPAPPSSSSMMPLHPQGSSRAPFVAYTTLYLKAGYKFDFGDLASTGQSQRRYNLPINQQIRLCAYTESTGVSLTDDCEVSSDGVMVDLLYSGNMRYTDA